MIEIIFNIGALIGFAMFCGFAFIGIKFTIMAWSYTAQLAMAEWKARRIRGLPPEKAKAELDKLMKEIEEEDKKNS